jgi:hypothetical protein
VALLYRPHRSAALITSERSRCTRWRPLLRIFLRK